jgi:CHAT domain-containing protein/tetratricopeptide (TPR) repeat protein
MEGSRELASDLTGDLRSMAAITIHPIEIIVEPKILLVVISPAIRSDYQISSARRPELAGLRNINCSFKGGRGMAYSSSPGSIHNRYFSLAIYISVLLSIGFLPFQHRNRQDLQDLSGFIGSMKTWKNGVNPVYFHQGDGQTRQLERGKPIEQELSGGQSHSYQITMTSGEFLYVVVNQRGIDVVVALFAPDGERRREADSHGTSGSETVSAIAGAAGTYRIEVRAFQKEARPGRYQINLEELKAATEEDKYRVAAESFFREAEQLEDGTSEERRKSIEKYGQALELYRRAGDRRGRVETLNKAGLVYWELGDLPKALERLNEALPITRSTNDRREEAITLNNLGLIHWSSGDMQKALENYNLALSISRAQGERSDEAGLLSNIGAVYRSRGEMQMALEKFNETLPIIREIGDRNGEAQILNNIGAVYWSLGEMQKALERLNEALPIYREVGDRDGEAITLNNIGSVYRLSGEMQVALEKYNEALPISRAVGARKIEAVTLSNIGTIYLSLEEMQKALEKYNEALPISRGVGDRSNEAATLNDIGRVYCSLGEMQKALENYNEALSIRRTIGERSGEAETLLGIARVEQKLGNLTRARQSIEQAIGIVESLRTNIASQELRASFFASRQEFYQSYIDVLMQLHKQSPAAAFDAAALAVSERARARSLLELLAEARADIRQGVDSSLLERERSLRQRLTAKSAAQVNLLSRHHTPDQAKAVAKEIASITAECEELEARIRTSSPRYAALTQPQPLNLSDIQQQVLDPETLLLEYALGDDASYLFVVSNDSITSYRLPKRAEIETATRRVYDLLTAPQPRPGETATNRRARIREARANYWPQAASLSRMLLGPAASQLGAKRLLIVADGALQYLPFGALPVPERRGDGETGRQIEGTIVRNNKSSPRPSPFHRKGTLPVAQSPSPLVSPTPLIAEHEILHLPSASTLAILRRELAGRQPAPKAVSVLADPVFSADDARVKLSTSDHKVPNSNLAPAELTRALTDVRGELTRLLMSRDEAQAILSFTTPNARLGALDFRASRATSTSDELSQYRIVHFATHGLLNSQQPKLSGLVLSLVDERGQPQDGFLQLHEIFNLRLPAELVVLSACQTGLGKEIRGEGLVGLTRGFMYAGAARVAASLWKVDDAATAELMKRFYRRMLQDGERPAAALRAAQVEMWKSPQWKLPYYWGAFVLQGEWK